MENEEEKNTLMVLPKQIQRSSIMEEDDTRANFCIGPSGRLLDIQLWKTNFECIIYQYLRECNLYYYEFEYVRKKLFRPKKPVLLRRQEHLLAYTFYPSIALSIENYSKCKLFFDDSVCKLKNSKIFSKNISEEFSSNDHRIKIIDNFERYIIAYFFNKKSTGKFLHIKAIKNKVKEQKIPHEYREKEYKIPYKYFKQGGIKTIPNLFPIIDEIIRKAFIFTDNQPSNLIKPRLFFDLDKI